MVLLNIRGSDCEIIRDALKKYMERERHETIPFYKRTQFLIDYFTNKLNQP